MANTSLTIAYITSRKQPRFLWFYVSLCKQLQNERPQIIFVSTDPTIENHVTKQDDHILAVNPKPTIWQGKHRITKTDWWAKSNAMNTAICLCKTDFIAFVDDRCVLAPQWLQCVRDAMAGNYAVCGSYEKRSGMKVENGEISDYGECLGVDTRHQYGEPVATRDWYGGSCALPLEWCLEVQGYNESYCDSLGLEDCMFGQTLKNSGFPMKFDSRMRIIEDRTPSEIEGALKRADKDVHLGNRAKSWGVVRALRNEKTSQNPFDIRNMRARVLNGEPFPPPTGSTLDWFDQQPISEFE